MTLLWYADNPRTGNVSQQLFSDHADILCFAIEIQTQEPLLFDKRILKENKLRSGLTESIYKGDEGKLQDQRRDTLKNYRDEACFIILTFGIENQSSYDRVMPVRILGYDSAGYKAQVEQKCRRLHSVITIVLNFSDRRWGKVKSLRDLMGSIPKELELYLRIIES